MVEKPLNPGEIAKSAPVTGGDDIVFMTGYAAQEKRRQLSAAQGENTSFRNTLTESAFSEKKQEDKERRRAVLNQILQAQISDLSFKLNHMEIAFDDVFAKREFLLEKFKTIRAHVYNLKIDRDEINRQIIAEEKNLKQIERDLDIHEEHEHNIEEQKQIDKELDDAIKNGEDPKKIKELERRKEACDGKCCESEEKVDGLEDDKATLEGKKQESEHRLGDLNQKKSGINAKLKEALEEHEACHKNLETNKNNIDSLKKDFAKMKEEIDNLPKDGSADNEAKRVELQEKLDAMEKDVREREEKYDLQLKEIEDDEHAKEIEQLKKELAQTDEDIKQETGNLASIENSLSKYFNAICEAVPDQVKDIGQAALSTAGELLGVPVPEFNEDNAALESEIMAKVESGNISRVELDEILEGQSQDIKDKFASKLESRGIKIKEPVPHAEHVPISSQPKSGPSELQNQFAAAAENQISQPKPMSDFKPSASFSFSA